jgi:2-polyprenyl-6-methoxyphenol hydroxylase-like FAD-dependent oxidoreductase
MADRDVPVLIVGGSLVGLTTALLLARHGIRSLAVERHAGTAIHPRAGHFHLRTMEVLRQAGLEERVRRTSVAMYDPEGGINAVESLAGRELATYVANLNEGVEGHSPTVRVFINQDVLEPILRERAEELGAEVRYRTEASGFEQDEDGVTVALRDLDSGLQSTVRARYVVGADGNRSPLRARLGIGMEGHGVLSDSITIYFRADCAPLLRDRNQGVIYVSNPDLRGFFRLDRSGGTGFLVVNTVGPDVTRPEAVRVGEGLTEERTLALLRSAIGVPDMPVEVVDVAHWRAEANVAERYTDGRIFLAGDAAHVVPPNGGYGGNTGVIDAHNLAWKLAWVLRGDAGEALLSTYEDERHPIGRLTIEQAYTRYATRVVPERGMDDVQPFIDDLSMEIGHRVRSSAVVPEPGEDDGAVVEHPSTDPGRPGMRAPHVELGGGSTLDLYGRVFVLLAGPDGEPWCAGAQAVARDTGIAIDTRRPDEAYGIAEAHGIGDEGAVLVRPDGLVAWRTKGAAEGAPEDVLRDVLATVLSRPADR